jgi:hypothetical protein
VTNIKVLYTFDESTVWLNPFDAAIICSLPRYIQFGGSVLLEVGVYRGGLVKTFLLNNKDWNVFGIDPYPGFSEVRDQMIYELGKSNLVNEFRLHDSWSGFLKEYNTTAGGIDLIHIDGEHSEVAVLKDLNESKTLLSKDGILIIDDIFSTTFPGITSATILFLNEGDFAPLLLSNKLYVCRKENYALYQTRLKSLLEELGIEFNTGFKAGTYGETYTQSNAIFGYEIITIISGEYSPEFRKNLGMPNVSNRKKLTLRKFIKSITPMGVVWLYTRKYRPKTKARN